MSKDLAYYRSLPYKLRVEPFEEEEDGEVYFRAFYEEIPRVQGIHKERMVAVQLAKELFDSYVEAQLEWGEEIPEPETSRYRKRGGLWTFRQADLSRSGSTWDDSVQESPEQEEETGTSSGGELARVG